MLATVLANSALQVGIMMIPAQMWNVMTLHQIAKSVRVVNGREWALLLASIVTQEGT